jgi:hypothetical protein
MAISKWGFIAAQAIGLSLIPVAVQASPVTGSGTFSGTFELTEAVFPIDEYYLIERRLVDSSEKQILSPILGVLPYAGGQGESTVEWGLKYADFHYEYSISFVGPWLPARDGDWTDEYFARTRLVPSGNKLSFTPQAFTDVQQGEPIVAGRLSYANGESQLETHISNVQLVLESTSSTPEFAQSIVLNISIVSMPNWDPEIGDLPPEQAADFIYFTDYPEFGSFRVYEGEETDVEVLVYFNSLHPVGFGAVGDASIGYVSSEVPEPSAMALLGVGSLALFRRRR